MSADGQQAAQPAAKANTAPAEFREMQQVEDHWADAVTKRDQYGLELVLAPQFIGISAVSYTHLDVYKRQAAG